MGGKKAVGENSKKAAGQARKADAAASKKAAEDNKKAAVDEAEWDKGSKKASAKKSVYPPCGTPTHKHTSTDQQQVASNETEPTSQRCNAPRPVPHTHAQKHIRLVPSTFLPLPQLPFCPVYSPCSVHLPPVSPAQRRLARGPTCRHDTTYIPYSHPHPLLTPSSPLHTSLHAPICMQAGTVTVIVPGVSSVRSFWVVFASVSSCVPVSMSCRVVSLYIRVCYTYV